MVKIGNVTIELTLPQYESPWTANVDRKRELKVHKSKIRRIMFTQRFESELRRLLPPIGLGEQGCHKSQLLCQGCQRISRAASLIYFSIGRDAAKYRIQKTKQKEENENRLFLKKLGHIWGSSYNRI